MSPVHETVVTSCNGGGQLCGTTSAVVVSTTVSDQLGISEIGLVSGPAASVEMQAVLGFRMLMAFGSAESGVFRLVLR